MALFPRLWRVGRWRSTSVVLLAALLSVSSVGGILAANLPEIADLPVGHTTTPAPASMVPSALAPRTSSSQATLRGCIPGSPICSAAPHEKGTPQGPFLLCNPETENGTEPVELNVTALSGPSPWTVYARVALFPSWSPYSATYAWNFGDGNTTSGGYTYDLCEEHTYVEPGAYLLNVTVTDGTLGTASDQVTVDVGPAQVEANWTEISVTQAPSARSGAAMAYDATEAETVLFGGTNTASQTLNDTWIFKGGAWTNITSELATSPPPLSEALMAFDAADGYLVLFGGTPAGSSSFGNTTWGFTGTTWEPLPSLPVGIAAWPALAYDASDQQVIFTGEIDQPCCSGETWSYVGGHWTLVEYLDPGFYYDPITYDTVAGKILQLGGWNGTYQTWVYHGGTWAELDPPFSPPWALDQPLIDDPALDGVVFATVNPYNGYPTDNCPDQNCFDTWTYVQGNWTNLTGIIPESPSTESGAPLTYDASTDQVLLFEGSHSTASGPEGNTWAFTQHPISGRLSVSATASVARGVAPLNVSFSATPQGGTAPYYYTWDFGDGTHDGTGSALYHTYYTSGTFVATVLVTDGFGATASWSLTVQVAAPGTGPTITSFTISPNPDPLGVPITFALTTAGGTNPLSYAYLGLPAGCASPNVSSFTCTPSASGTFEVQANVTDAAGLYDTTEESLVVSAAASGPTILSFNASPDSLAVGNSTTFTVETSGGTAPLTFAYEGLPSGCATVNSSTFTCRPTEAGTFAVEVAVTDAAGHSASAQTTLQVLPVAATLVIGSFDVTPTDVLVGGQVTFEVVVSGGVPPYTYVYEVLPPGCVSENSPSLTCHPSGAGTYLVDVYVYDSANHTAAASAPLEVSSLSPVGPSISGASFPLLLTLAGGGAVVLLAIGLVIYLARKRTPRNAGPRPPRPAAPDPPPPP